MHAALHALFRVLSVQTLLQFGDAVGLSGLVNIILDQFQEPLGIIDKSHGEGLANTALVYHGNRLLALHEGDKPYAVSVHAPAGGLVARA